MTDRGGSWPDWRDSGRSGSIVIDGHVVLGVVYADDYLFDGEEEIPVFNFHANDGRKFSFCDHDESFRFEDHAP